MSEAFFVPGDVAWTELENGTTRAVLAHRPEMMMVAVGFRMGGVGEPHAHPHTQVSYVAKGLFEVTVDGATQTIGAGGSFVVAPNLVHGVVALEDGLLIDCFTPRRDDFL